MRLPSFGKLAKDPGPRISVVVPARNEEDKIYDCLKDLSRQELKSEFFEVLVVDDHSEDQTAEVARKFIANHSGGPVIRLLQADTINRPDFISFKKQALLSGIQKAKGEWIVTTDADCRMSSKWLASVAGMIQTGKAEFISGPVALYRENNWFEKAQSLEFMGLIGIGAASIRNGRPNMCNGANLAFRKETFLKVGGYQGIDHIASGDDELLMHRISKRFPGRVRFLKSPEAIVCTQPAITLKSFINQRKRWVSKSRKYENKKITAVLFLVYLFYVLLLVIPFLPGFLIKVFFPVFILKESLEFLFLYKVSKFFGKRKLMVLYFPVSVIYIFYIIFIGIFGNTGGYRWKNRKVR